ncbi:MAG: hypothetical protein E7369_03410 [Clostridiales bacterium]|nr:hypothetical protein [Clostridiales bacterium]
MSANILTPITIWGNFSIKQPVLAELVEEKVKGEITYRKIYIDGRTVGKERVKIFGVIAKKEQPSIQPAVIIFSDFERGMDLSLVEKLAQSGYTALAIDLNGKPENSDLKNYTVYPDKVGYANYDLSKDSLDKISTDAIGTCWYEWAAAAKYAISYLKAQPCVSKIGAIGVKEGAGVLWHALANNENVDCAVFVMNAGWKAYKGIFKFSGASEPQFSDETLKYVAGIEPQGYAKHVKCHCLMLSPTNSDEYDCDRAYDTIARINENAYRSACYSVGSVDTVDFRTITRTRIFFEEFLGGNGKGDLPFEPDIKCDIEDGGLVFHVNVDPNGLNRPSVYVSEELLEPQKRAWIKLTDCIKIGDGEFLFKYSPYHQSKKVFAFSKASYQNGYALCSNVISKKFKETEVKKTFKDKIVYSSRDSRLESVFAAITEKDAPSSWRESDKHCLKFKKGPMSIDGVSASGGLRTFKISAEKYLPNDYAILMLDIFTKDKCELTVKLIKDFFGEKVEYVAKTNVNGGKIWHNVRLEMNKFKTEEGRILKTYQGIDAIEFYVSCDYLINNVLWI